MKRMALLLLLAAPLSAQEPVSEERSVPAVRPVPAGGVKKSARPPRQLRPKRTPPAPKKQAVAVSTAPAAVPLTPITPANP